MIQLPDTYIQTIRVDNNMFWLHLVNDSAQFFSHVVAFDPALGVDEQIEMFQQSLSPDQLQQLNAYRLRMDLTREEVGPSDQNWRPAPMASSAVSLAQFKAMKGLPS